MGVSQDKLRIIGVAGTNGAGKDLLGQLLAERHNYLFISVTNILREELQRRSLPPDRAHMRELSAEWRRERGFGVLVELAVEKFKATGVTYAMSASRLMRSHEGLLELSMIKKPLSNSCLMKRQKCTNPAMKRRSI
jgi:dephospho-CoA kinase